MPQFRNNSRWLGQDSGIFAIYIRFGQIVSTSADRLILNQIRHCFELHQNNKVLTADKIATLRTAKAKSFAIQSIAEELQNQPNLSNTKRQRQTTTCLCCQSNLFKQGWPRSCTLQFTIQYYCICAYILIWYRVDTLANLLQTNNSWHITTVECKCWAEYTYIVYYITV